MVPLMAEAGIRFLHLGVNTASPGAGCARPSSAGAPPDGSELVVMYQASYGETDFPAGSDDRAELCPHQRQYGPAERAARPSTSSGHCSHAYPDAEIMASTLDAFGAEMWARREQFPVVTQDIGDSWIHGAASDPQKLAAVPRAAAALRWLRSS